MAAPSRSDIALLIVGVVGYFATFAAAFATLDWKWLVVGWIVPVSAGSAIVASRIERRSSMRRCPTCGGGGRIGTVSDDRLDQFVRIVHTQFPAYRVKVQDWSTDDPGIRHFVHVTGVPRDRLAAVEDRCWDIATEVYGTEPIPFLLTAVSPETEAGR